MSTQYVFKPAQNSFWHSVRSPKYKYHCNSTLLKFVLFPRMRLMLSIWFIIFLTHRRCCFYFNGPISQSPNRQVSLEDYHRCSDFSHDILITLIIISMILLYILSLVRLLNYTCINWYGSIRPSRTSRVCAVWFGIIQLIRTIITQNLYASISKIIVNMETIFQGFGTSSSSLDGWQQVEPKYPALLFKQQLTAYVEKLYRIVRDNLKKKLSSPLDSFTKVLPLVFHCPLKDLCTKWFYFNLDKLTRKSWDTRNWSLGICS